MLELGGSGGMLPQEIFEKLMLKYCNLETFPHKIPNIFCLWIFYILPLDYRYGSLKHYAKATPSQTLVSGHPPAW